VKVGDLVKFGSNHIIGNGDRVGIIVALGAPASAIVHWSDSNTRSFISTDALEVLSPYEGR
jgi:hypothetical protein